MFSIYIVVDRFIEILFIGATGMAVSYWGPFKYTFAMACLIFALEFCFSSKFVKQDTIKLSYFYLFSIGFYIVAISMVVQWINKLEWMLFFAVPNYEYIFDNFYELIKPAFSAIAWYIPIISFFKVLIWIKSDSALSLYFFNSDLYLAIFSLSLCFSLFSYQLSDR